VTENKSGELIAVMANTVAEARHSLSIPEQRLILWLVAQIEREDDCFKEHTLSVPEFEEILGQTNNGRLHEQIEEACNRLQTRVLEILTGPKERTKFNWMHSITYLDGEARVKLRLHDLLAPVLIQLKARFCQIPLRAAFKMRGGYAIRWMEMLYSKQHTGSFAMSVEELRDWLALAPDELKTTDHLRSRAIDYPRRELEAKSPLSFTYKSRKVGRRITSWVFTVKKNTPRRVKKNVPAIEPQRITEEEMKAIKESLLQKNTNSFTPATDPFSKKQTALIHGSTLKD